MAKDNAMKRTLIYLSTFAKKGELWNHIKRGRIDLVFCWLLVATVTVWANAPGWKIK